MRPPSAVTLSSEVHQALDARHPVVALETSVLSHGLPRPRNEEAAHRMTAAIRAAGAVPAWVWVGRGALHVGAGEEQLGRLAAGAVAKVARRDLPMAVAGGGIGGTTVSATVWAAGRTGIEVAATGGIGGVHPGSSDVSADLLELARTPVTLVCSGPKSILDPVATMERLEELGVGTIGYRCDRLPFFVVPEAPVPVEHRVEDLTGVAEAVRVRRELGIDATLVVLNPVPAEHALDADEVAAAVARCRARAGDMAGKDLTPLLLRCLAEETGGRSVEANVALLEANAALAAEVAGMTAVPRPGGGPPPPGP